MSGRAAPSGAWWVFASFDFAVEFVEDGTSDGSFVSSAALVHCDAEIVPRMVQFGLFPFRGGTSLSGSKHLTETNNILGGVEFTPAHSQMEAIGAGLFSKGAQRCAEDLCHFLFGE